MMIALGITVFLMTVVFHEVCHGWTANALGDPTAKQQGRLTLNPLKHIDPFWTVLLPALLFFSTGGRFAIGMAKPVPVNFMRLRKPKRDMMLVAVAGPLANLLFAVVLKFLFDTTLMDIFLYAIYFNLGLALFNMIPIPPLDGSRIVFGLIPSRFEKYFIKLERVGFLIIILLYFSGILFKIIIPGVNFFATLLGIPNLRI